MTASAEMLRVYVATNLCLAGSLLALVAARRKAVALASHRDWLFLGKLLLLASLTLPAAATLAPSHWLRSMTWLTPAHTTRAGRFLGADSAPGIPRSAAGAAPRATEPAVGKAAPSGSSWLSWEPALALGALLMALRLTWALGRLGSLLRGASPLRRIGRVRVLVSDETSIPFATAVGFHASVVLPVDILGSRRDATLAIRHELQHHRQGDTRWVLALEALKIACFANPAAYLWARKMAELQEFACDEALVESPRVGRLDYGHCLLRVAEATLPRHPALLATAGMSNSRSLGKSFLKRRILMITTPKSPSSRKYFLGIAAGTLAVFLWLAAGASAALVKGRETASAGLPAVHPALQAIAENALREGLEKAKAEDGLALVADPETGRIYAAAHAERTTPLSLAEYLSQAAQPWSVMKPLVVAVALDMGKTRVDEVHDCENGLYLVGQKQYTDYKPFGKLTTAEAIIQSSNICSIKVAQKVEGPKLTDAIAELGFGPKNAAFEYPGATHGVIPTEEALEPEQLSPSFAFGYGLRATPLEVVGAYGALANGGKLLRLQEYRSAAEPQVLRQVVTPETASAVRKILARVVTEGTGTSAASARYTTAGKTGTGRLKSVPFSIREVASFVGFAPAGAPKLVVYVALQAPHNGDTTGGRHAAPVFRRIVDESLAALGVPPDKP